MRHRRSGTGRRLRGAASRASHDSPTSGEWSPRLEPRFAGGATRGQPMIAGMTAATEKPVGGSRAARTGFRMATPRALPDRRQLACLPGVLRAAGVDRDERRAADQRDLRARLDAGQDHRRAPPGRGRRRLGRGDVGARGHLRPLQGAAHPAARPAARAVAAPDAAGRGLRLHQRQGRGLRGRRRDRLAGPAGARGGDPGDGRHRRPRRLPAGRRRGAGDEHLARDHRDQGLRPRRR